MCKPESTQSLLVYPVACKWVTKLRVLKTRQQKKKHNSNKELRTRVRRGIKQMKTRYASKKKHHITRYFTCTDKIFCKFNFSTSNGALFKCVYLAFIKNKTINRNVNGWWKQDIANEQKKEEKSSRWTHYFLCYRLECVHSCENI